MTNSKTDELCRCGHGREAHYKYCNNGKETTRCKRCDPWIRNGIKGGGVFEVIAGSEFDQQDRAADHPFEVSAARAN